ncbi:MAG: hypothetical protein R3C05_26895 [Pirellulaceae bacterium]
MTRLPSSDANAASPVQRIASIMLRSTSRDLQALLIEGRETVDDATFAICVAAGFEGLEADGFFNTFHHDYTAGESSWKDAAKARSHSSLLDFGG